MGYEINAATNASARGVAYWPGDNRSPASIFFGTSDGRSRGCERCYWQTNAWIRCRGIFDLLHLTNML
jgi:hypothetical protein